MGHHLSGPCPEAITSFDQQTSFQRTRKRGRAASGGSNMSQGTSRREFLAQLGVGTAAATLGASAGFGVPGIARALEKPKGNIPSNPFRIGHMTFFTGPGAVLGEPMYKGNLLAAEEINAQGGLLGKRKIEILKADEAAGTDANTKEMRRLKLSEKIDLFMGITSSGNTPALGPVGEELRLLTIFIDGCTDFLFDKAVPNPHHIFRITNIQSADGVTAAVATAMTWPQVRKIAHIHPDYSYGRNLFDHFTVAINKLMPGTQIVYQGWPKLGTTDFTSHITAAIAAKPDLLMTGVWGGDYLAFYKQALRYDLFKKMKMTTTVAFAVAPHAIGKDHPEGVIAGVHSNYYFNFPPTGKWPVNDAFVKKYYKRWKEYPNFQSEGAYVTLYMLKDAVERANRLMGGWPDDEAIIGQLEGLGFTGPAGYLYIRPDNH